MTPEEIEAVAPSIVVVLSDALRSSRWENPDYPGSAHIKELSEHLQSVKAYSDFRSTETGAYFLEIVEPLQSAMNDDWLPNTLFGLKLLAARELLRVAIDEIGSKGLVHSVTTLRAHYSRLAHES